MKTILTSGLLAALFATGAYALVASPASAAPKIIHIEIHNFAFVPARVEAHVGDTIEWTNRDFAPHTATDVHGKWSTPSLVKDASARITIKTAGSLGYACKFHPQMKGNLVVSASTVRLGEPR